MLRSVGATVLEKTSETIRQALTTFQTQDVCDWVKSKLGMTIPGAAKTGLRRNKTGAHNRTHRHTLLSRSGHDTTCCGIEPISG